MRTFARPTFITTLVLALGLLAAGCGAGEDSSQTHGEGGVKPAAGTAGSIKVEYCYGLGEAGEDVGQDSSVCIVRFGDGATCTRSYESYHNTYVYADCRGGKFDALTGSRAAPAVPVG